MATRTRVKFNAQKWAQEVFKNASEEQTRRLIEYAKQEIVKIGNMILTYHSRNHMDRTGNLLNSLCWGVMYKGTMKGHGFLRDEVLRPRGVEGSSDSYLHEFFERTEVVEGRKLAEQYIASYRGTSDGWRVFFAILAPYWGYWESGFRLKSGGGSTYKGTSRENRIPKSMGFRQFAVMSQFFDEIRMDLKPAKVSLTVYVPKYSYKNTRYMGKRGTRKWGKGGKPKF